MEKDFSFSTYIVRSRKLSYFLQFKNFRLLGTQPNKDNPNWQVFLFKNSPELREAINEYRELSK